MELYSHQPSIANILTGIRKGTNNIKVPLQHIFKVKAESFISQWNTDMKKTCMRQTHWIITDSYGK